MGKNGIGLHLFLICVNLPARAYGRLVLLVAGGRACNGRRVCVICGQNYPKQPWAEMGKNGMGKITQNSLGLKWVNMGEWGSAAGDRPGSFRLLAR